MKSQHFKCTETFYSTTECGKKAPEESSWARLVPRRVLRGGKNLNSGMQAQKMHFKDLFERKL